MDDKKLELGFNLYTILEKEKHDIKHNIPQFKYYYENPNIIDTKDKNILSLKNESDYPYNYNINITGLKYKNESVELILKYYYSNIKETELKTYIIDGLISQLKKESSSLGLEVIIKIIGFQELIKGYFLKLDLEKEINKDYSNIFYQTCKTVYRLLVFEYNLFNEDDLFLLKIIYQKTNDYEKKNRLFYDISTNKQIIIKIIDRITILSYNKTSEKILSSIDPDFYNDSQVIKQMINKYSFPADLSEILDKIEKIKLQESDKFDYSMAISKLREYFNQLLDNISDRIFEKNKIEIIIDETTGKKNNINYLKKHLNLDDDLCGLMKKLISLYNRNGSHTLISNNVYFRLINNITIEISYLLLVKMDNYIKES